MPAPKLPYAIVNGQKVAPFKNPEDKPYGAFANTTNAGEYPVAQTKVIHGETLNFKWPSSEHAYHAQKLLHLKSKLPANDPAQAILTKALRTIENSKKGPGEQFMPRDDFDPIINKMITDNHPMFGNDKKAFDTMCDANYHSQHNPTGGINPVTGKPYTYDFMKEVIKLKLEQNPELKELAMQMARDGIMPIEVSRFDNNWATGKSGNGKNMLGVIILEMGNELLKKNGETPAIPDPAAHYQSMANTRSKDDNLAHDALLKTAWEVTAEKHRGAPPAPPPPIQVQPLGRAQPTQSPPPSSSISTLSSGPLQKGHTTQRGANFLQKIPDIEKAIGPDWKKEQKQGQPVVFKNGKTSFQVAPGKLTTQSEDKATFVAMLKAFQASSPGKTPVINTDNPKAAALWADAMKEVYPSITNPSINVSQPQQQQQQQQTTPKPT